MTKRVFVFCHGFGFAPTYWQQLKPYFDPAATFELNLGYFSCKQPITTDLKGFECIGIGHSLGLIKLIQSGIPFKALIGLNGFIDFIGQDDSLKKRRYIELKALTKQFKSSPNQALSDFYERCGIPEQNVNQNLDIDHLLCDLSLLSQAQTLENDIKTLIIAAKDDIVVPEPLIYDNFLNRKNVTIIMHDTGKHALGYVHAQSIYHEIKTFLEQHV